MIFLEMKITTLYYMEKLQFLTTKKQQYIKQFLALVILKIKNVEVGNYKVKNFGTAEGSTDAVPDDAALVILAAPEEPLLPEENRTLEEFMNKGGKLMVLLDPGADTMEPLLGKLGLKSGTAAVAHHQAFIRQTRGKGDRVLLVTNRFGSHPSVEFLSKNSTQLALIMPTTVALEKVEGATAKHTTIIRSFPDSWVDTNRNLERDDDEPQRGDAERGEERGEEPEQQPRHLLPPEVPKKR